MVVNYLSAISCFTNITGTAALSCYKCRGVADDENGCYTGNMTDSFKVECEKPFDVETEYRCYSLKLTYNSNEKMNSMERLVESHLTTLSNWDNSAVIEVIF